MDDLYREQILDHYRDPRNRGKLAESDISNEEDNPLCGDHVRMDIKLDEEERVIDVAWEGDGCAISMASASMLSDYIKGKKLDELRQLGKDEMLGMLGIELGPVRLKCALLSLKVLRAGAFGLTGWPDEA